MTIHFQSVSEDVIKSAVEHSISGKPMEQETPSNNKEQPATLRDHIKSMLKDYFDDLDGHQPADLYQLVLAEIEQPLLETVLTHTRGNQSKAAILLGLNRGTLRKKLKQYNMG
jgi:Fis family transcriptional regulator